MAQLNQELIKRMLDAQANPVEAFDPTKVTQAVSSGIDIADTIQARKQSQEDRVRALKEKIDQAKKESELVKTATRGNQVANVGGQPVFSSQVQSLAPETDLLGKAAAVDTKGFADAIFKEQLQKMKDKSSSGRGTPVSLINPTTGERQFKVVREDADIPSGFIREFAPQTRLNPVTGQLEQITSVGGSSSVGGGQGTRTILDPHDLTVRQSNILTDFRDRFNKDDVIAAANTNLTAIENLEVIQNQGFPALIGSLKSLRARALAGEKGVLTEQDVERTTGDPRLTSRFVRAFDRLILGSERPEDIAEFKATIAEVKRVAKERIEQRRAAFIDQARSTKELNNLDPDLINRNIALPASSVIPTPGIPATPGAPGNPGMTPEKQARLAELRAKKAAGTLGR